MTFFYGNTKHGATVQGNVLSVTQDGRYASIMVDEELRDLLLRELLVDDVLGDAVNAYNAVCARIDARTAA